jgi:hypothetical protein
MGPEEADDVRQTSDLAAPTTPIEGIQRRRRGIWLPLILFAVLIAGGIYVGLGVIPQPAPQSGGTPHTRSPSAGPTLRPTGPTPTSTLVVPDAPVRPADALAAWASQISPAVNIPVTAVEAYGYAQLQMQQTDPQCHLGWTTLAGIGEVESKHGQAGGAVLQPNGRSQPVIRGPALDGNGGRALVRDTDGGAFDGDEHFDREMGPMHLLPTHWRRFGADADKDQLLDPYDIDDATMAMASLLCSGTDDLSTRTGWNAAIGLFRSGTTYATKVFQAADSYGQRTRNIG